VSAKLSSHLRARARVRSAIFFCALLAVIASCSDSGLFSPNTNGRARVAIRPYFASLQGVASMAAEINRIRLTITRRPEGTLVFQDVFDVDPNATDWNLPVDVPANSDLDVLIELINYSSGVETVEFSGIIQLSVTAGPQPTTLPVPVFPGPPDNLLVTAITIAPRDQTVLEGEHIQFTANVAGTTTAQVIWGSINSNVATVDASGGVDARAPGTALISAIAGPKSDAVTVTVRPRVTAVQVTPALVTVPSIGGTATFVAKAIDIRNAEVTGLTFTWSVGDESVATMVSPGVFRALRNGETQVTATTTQGGRTFSAQGTLRVSQTAATVTVAPPSQNFTALDQTHQFTAQAKDAGGNVLAVAFTWTSDHEDVATVDGNGLVTATGNGTAHIRATNGAASGEATVTVQQVAVRFAVTPAETVLDNTAATVQLTAAIRDANDNPMPTDAVHWSTSDLRVALVDQNGLVTANGDGLAVITATVGDLSATATVRVERAAQSVIMRNTIAEMTVGESFTFTALALDASGSGIVNYPLQWSSSNPDVATVGETTGVVHAVGQGDVVITVRAGTATASANLHVIAGGAFHIANGRVLLYHADSGVAEDFKARLIGTGVFTADKIDVQVMTETLPTLEQLAQYGCVLAWTDFAPPVPDLIGNRLQEYVDAGGKVVLAVYALGFPSRPWELQGGIMGAGYNPLLLTENQVETSSHSLNFETALTSHPILEGVTSFTYFSNGNYMRPALAPGATLVGSDNHGDPVIAVNATGHVVALNVWPGYPSHGATSSEPFIDRAFANACR